MGDTSEYQLARPCVYNHWVRIDISMGRFPKMTRTSETCRKCGIDVATNERFCPSCGTDLGAPNVRECGSQGERDALLTRYDDAVKATQAAGLDDERQKFEETVDTMSGVVLAMPARLARELFTDPRGVYANYEQLVGATMRRPATTADDTRRFAVGGLLFGHNLSEIKYGNLAIELEGLPTYGQVVGRLRDVTVEHRVSFLECNSYTFAKRVGSLGDGIPVGYRAVWDNRAQLATAKLAPELQRGQDKESWKQLLVKSDGKDRSNDDFIEAHIFGEINARSFESLAEITGVRLNRQAKTDVRIAIEQFQKLSRKIV